MFRMNKVDTKFGFGSKTINRFFREAGGAESQNFNHVYLTFDFSEI